MNGLAFTATATSGKPFLTCRTRLVTFSPKRRSAIRILCFNKRSNAFTVCASRDESPKLDKSDVMELKFGLLIGEDPKLTLAKIMGRKANPGASYLDIEKSFYKNKGKLVEVEEVPFGVSKRKSSSSLDDLGLVRPVPVKGTKFKSEDNKVPLEIKKPSKPATKTGNETKSGGPNVILRKPTVYNEDGNEDISSKLRLRPDLYLKTRNEQSNDKFSDMTQLRKPEKSITKETDLKQEPSALVNSQMTNDNDSKIRKEESGEMTLLKKPEPSKLRLKPDLSLKTLNEQSNDQFSYMTQLRKPEKSITKESNLKQEPSAPVNAQMTNDNDSKIRKEESGEMTLLKKPEPSIPKETDQNVCVQMNNGNDMQLGRDELDDKTGNLTLLERPDKAPSKKDEDFGEVDASVLNDGLEQHRKRHLESHQDQTDSSQRPDLNSADSRVEFPVEVALQRILTLLERPDKEASKKHEEFGEADVSVPNDGLEQHKQRHVESHHEQTYARQLSDLNSADSRVELPADAALQGKPERLDQPLKETSKSTVEVTAIENPGDDKSSAELENLPATTNFQESEDSEWTRAEDLVKNGEWVNVELISCSTRGFGATFGSLVGFLPYHDLSDRWRFFAFETWLRKKGLDPSFYKQNLGIVTSYDSEIKYFPLTSPHMKADNIVEEKISPDMKFEDLLRIYNQEKIRFLSSFIGQKASVNIVLADRKLRKLVFSSKPKVEEELVEKKRNLMARLQVGDIVKCTVQKIKYFGIFVEVEGVPALIHQTEVSWNATLDPASYFKIGQIVEAKVHQLNFASERIFLSLKEIMPNPSLNSLESLHRNLEPIDERLEAAEPDAEWSEVECLIQELKQIDGIQSVTKGRFFRSPGLAPTFQVYMASESEDQYKLLARSGNRMHEVMVQTSLDKEKMKSAILTCTNRVK